MSTVGPTNLPAYFNTDADFRTWGSTISVALATLGLVQTSDTGQINWTTVTKPSSPSTSQGYEIWRFSDSLQSTAPVFLKLEYGCAGVINMPSLWITVGSSSNGTGTLLGQVCTRVQSASGATKSAGITLLTYVCGTTSELYLATNVDTTATTFGAFVSVARLKDSNGSDTNEGALLLVANANVGPSSQYIPASGSVPSQVTTTPWPAVHPNFYLRSVAGANGTVCPLLLPAPGGSWRYSRVLVTNDFPAGGTFNVTLFGASHTLMALAQSCLTTNQVCPNGLGTTVAGFAMPWE